MNTSFSLVKKQNYRGFSGYRNFLQVWLTDLTRIKELQGMEGMRH